MTDRTLDGVGLALSAVGIGLQFAGQFAFAAASRAQVAVMIAGTATLAVGLGFLAARKGRSVLFGILAPTSCIGFLIVFMLPKHCRRCGTPGGIESPACEKCGASM